MELGQLTAKLWTGIRKIDLWDKVAITAVPLDAVTQIAQDSAELGVFLEEINSHSGNFFPVLYIAGLIRTRFNRYTSVATATSIGVGMEVAQHFGPLPETGEPNDALASLAAGALSLLMAQRYGNKYESNET